VSFAQNLVWRLEALAYDALSLILKLFPFNGISAFGGWLLRKIGPLTSKHRIAKTGITIAFPDKSEVEIKKLLTEQWDNTGRTFAEFPITHRIKAFTGSQVIIKGLEIFEKHGSAKNMARNSLSKNPRIKAGVNYSRPLKKGKALPF